MALCHYSCASNSGAFEIVPLIFQAFCVLKQPKTADFHNSRTMEDSPVFQTPEMFLCIL